MTTYSNKTVVPQAQTENQDTDESIFAQHEQALVAHRDSLSSTLQMAPTNPLLQQAVQALCETYVTLDLRLETTFAAAEHDFIAALHEISGHDEALQHMVSLLIKQLRQSRPDLRSDQIVLNLAFSGEDDLMQQMMAIETAEGDAS